MTGEHKWDWVFRERNTRELQMWYTIGQCTGSLVPSSTLEAADVEVIWGHAKNLRNRKMSKERTVHLYDQLCG